MITRLQHRLAVYAAADKEGLAPQDERHTEMPAARLRPGAGKAISDFAVGFSRQPLPIGNRFAIVTNAGGPGIMATDAATCRGLELAKLRPETLETHKAKLPPTANPFHAVGVVGGVLRTVSTAGEARAGFKSITNGVKQTLPSARLPGVEIRAKAELLVVLAVPASTS